MINQFIFEDLLDEEKKIILLLSKRMYEPDLNYLATMFKNDVPVFWGYVKL